MASSTLPIRYPQSGGSNRPSQPRVGSSQSHANPAVVLPKQRSSADNKNRQIMHPGVRGGHFYWDRNGKLRYGDPPPGSKPLHPYEKVPEAHKNAAMEEFNQASQDVTKGKIKDYNQAILDSSEHPGRVIQLFNELSVDRTITPFFVDRNLRYYASNLASNVHAVLAHNYIDDPDVVNELKKGLEKLRGYKKDGRVGGTDIKEVRSQLPKLSAHLAYLFAYGQVPLPKMPAQPPEYVFNGIAGTANRTALQAILRFGFLPTEHSADFGPGVYMKIAKFDRMETRPDAFTAPTVERFTGRTIEHEGNTYGEPTDKAFVQLSLDKNAKVLNLLEDKETADSLHSIYSGDYKQYAKLHNYDAVIGRHPAQLKEGVQMCVYNYNKLHITGWGHSIDKQGNLLKALRGHEQEGATFISGHNKIIMSVEGLAKTYPVRERVAA